MTRTSVSALLVFASSALPVLSVATDTEAAPPRPNIVLILVDDKYVLALY